MELASLDLVGDEPERRQHFLASFLVREVCHTLYTSTLPILVTIRMLKD